MENKLEQQSGAEAKTDLMEQVNACLHAAEYARALDLLRGAAAEFPDDPELSELEQRAHEGAKRNAEANRLITESQELFAQQKSAEAIQLLRQAYDLEKNNSLARAILANALVEHAQSLAETDWWEAGKLAKQALELNPAHPTAKTIRSLIQSRKEASSIEEWVAQVQKVQASGDLIGALSMIAEGLDVHARDPKLLLLQDAIQRDQDARRRQSRRGDLEDLRRMESEINGATDPAGKAALAERIQLLAAKYWTDGAVLTVANHLLQRLGFQQKTSTSSPNGKGAPVIFHVPRPGAPAAPRAESTPVAPSKKAPSQVSPRSVAPAPAPPEKVLPIPVSSIPAPPIQVPPAPVAAAPVSAAPIPAAQVPATPVQASPVAAASARSEVAPASKVPASKPPMRSVPPRVVPRTKVRVAPPESELASLSTSVRVTEPAAPPSAEVATSTSRRKEPARSKVTTLILISSAAAVVLLGAAIFFSRKHPAASVATAPAPTPVVAVPTTSTSAPAASAPAPAVSAPPQGNPEPSAPALPAANNPAATATPADRPVPDRPANDQPPAESARNAGALVVVAGQNGAKVFLNGKQQRQLTQAGELRLPNLEPKDYVVQVSKSGFQDSPQQKIRIAKGQETRLIFVLQPQPRLASLTIQGGAPGTAVLVDQASVGTIQADGTLSISTVNPGDHVVELRKDRFKPRQFKKQFVAGGTVTLAAADAELEGLPGELKITFAPPDAKVAIVKGDLLKIVSSGVPLTLPPGTYTLTARSADRIMRSATLEVVAGQSKSVDLSLAPNGMLKWEDPMAWKHEGDSFIRKGGEFVLYGAVPASGTFIFSAMPVKGHLLQWVLNYADSRNYVLVQLDDNAFTRAVIRNGQKTDEVRIPNKEDRKSFRTLQVRVSPTEIVHQIKHGDSWTVLDRWTQPGANLGLGKFGFYIPGNDEVALSSFAHYGELNIH